MKIKDKKKKWAAVLGLLGAILVYALLSLVLPSRALAFVAVVVFIFSVACIAIMNFRQTADNHPALCEVLIDIILASTVVILLLAEHYTFENSRQLQFLGVALALGVACGIINTVISMKSKKKPVALAVSGIAVAVISVIVFNCLICHMNYVFDFSEPEECVAVVEDKYEQRHRRSKDYIVAVRYNEKRIRFDVPLSCYDRCEIGSDFDFKRYKGAFNEPFYISSAAE